MGLRFGRSSSDGCPGYEIGDVLWRDGVEEFRSGGNTEIDNVSKKIASDPKAFVDVGGFVEIGIHNQPFPSERSAGLFKVDSHDEANSVFYAFA